MRRILGGTLGWTAPRGSCLPTRVQGLSVHRILDTGWTMHPASTDLKWPWTGACSDWVVYASCLWTCLHEAATNLQALLHASHVLQDPQKDAVASSTRPDPWWKLSTAFTPAAGAWTMLYKHPHLLIAPGVRKRLCLSASAAVSSTAPSNV